MPLNNETSFINDIIARAVLEDCNSYGDITSHAIFDSQTQASALIRSKGIGILSGGYLLKPIFRAIDPTLDVTILHTDGQPLIHGTRICTLHGSICSILTGERIALNFLQRLSGIATVTSSLVNHISHTSAKLLDTRKTTPTLRYFEKRAVTDGGGVNHRFGLFDMILIKDTHVKASGGVTKALQKALASDAVTNRHVKIEVEVQTWDEFLEAVELSPNRIMLDNMDIPTMTACVTHVRTKKLPIELEASGNITQTTIAAVAETGVDYISVGAITHSVPALDIHLVIE
jgi:nicotinate-nucleotide pyrophosphorylase (carboxylating)